MAEVVLNAEQRTAPAKEVRREDKVPGVYYAHGDQNINIQVPRVNLNSIVYTSEASIIDLRVGQGESRKCVLRDVQYDPVSDRPIHFDLQGLKENEEIEIEIPVVLTGGIPKGVRDGGVLQHLIHKLEISCLPKNIPGRVEVNVGALELNRTIFVRDLNVPNVTILEGMDSPVVGVIPPKVVAEPTPDVVAEEAAKEPEVVGKGKKVEEGTEGAEAPKAEAKAKPEGKEEKKEKK